MLTVGGMRTSISERRDVRNQTPAPRFLKYKETAQADYSKYCKLFPFAGHRLSQQMQVGKLGHVAVSPRRDSLCTVNC